MAIIYDGPIVTGTDEIDTLYGIAGDDTLIGLGGDDILYGDTDGFPAGNDTLNGGTGSDTLYGGDGIDTFVVTDAADQVYGGDGDDRVAVIGNVGSLSSLTIDGGTGFNSLIFSSSAPASSQVVYDLTQLNYSNIQLLTCAGSGVAVRLTAAQFNGFANVFVQLTATLFAASGGVFDATGKPVDKFKASPFGNTFIDGSPGGAIVTLTGDVGNDVFYCGGARGYTAYGMEGSDRLFGGTHQNVFYGGDGADQLVGNIDRDFLDGGAGVDQLTGGLSADVFKFSALTDSVHTNGQMDRIADFVVGQDKIDLSGLGFSGVTTGTPATGQLKVSYNSYYNHTYVRDLSGSGFGFYLTGNHINLSNTDFIGLIPAGQTITGTPGNNVLQGSNGDDVINGLGGADQLLGNGGNDTLDGGTGVDQLTGGLGADRFKFGAVTDSIFSTGQMDRIADFVVGTDKVDLTGLGFSGVTSGTPSPGQLKVSYDSYYNHTYVRDLTGGTGFGFYLSGNHTALTNADFIGLVSSFGGLSAGFNSSKTNRFNSELNSALDNSFHNLVNAMASFVPAATSSSSRNFEDLQRPQLYGELTSGG